MAFLSNNNHGLEDIYNLTLNNTNFFNTQGNISKRHVLAFSVVRTAPSDKESSWKLSISLVLIMFSVQPRI